jgi:hypothetical protein
MSAVLRRSVSLTVRKADKPSVVLQVARVARHARAYAAIERLCDRMADGIYRNGTEHVFENFGRYSVPSRTCSRSRRGG